VPSRDQGFPCPTCGADVPARARSCPECGSDEETGWSEDTLYDGLDLPDPGYGREEPEARPLRSFVATTAVIVAVALIVAFLVFRAR
jgi:hypothetical protein